MHETDDQYLLRRLLFQFLLFLRAGAGFLCFCNLLENLFEFKSYENFTFSDARQMTS